MILATGNSGKVKEFNFLLGGLVESPPRTLVIPETGQTYYENGLLKAMRYYEAFKKPVLADDSGLEVDALGGAPGVYAADFGGVISWPERLQLLVSKLSSFPPEQWTAHFRAVLCYYDGKKAPVFFEGVVSGKIVATPAGTGGFGYDSIFFSPHLGKTFAQASEAEKNTVSHRTIATGQLKKFLAIQ